MYYSLFLDDIRYPKDVKWVNLPLVEWVVVRSYDQFVRAIEKAGLPARISFDFDLANEHMMAFIEHCERTGDPDSYQIPDTFVEKTGLDCAKWLVEYCSARKVGLPEWGVHSINPSGRKKIEELLTNYRPQEKE